MSKIALHLHQSLRKTEENESATRFLATPYNIVTLSKKEPQTQVFSCKF